VENGEEGTGNLLVVDLRVIMLRWTPPTRRGDTEVKPASREKLSPQETMLPPKGTTGVLVELRRSTQVPQDGQILLEILISPTTDLTSPTTLFPFLLDVGAVGGWGAVDLGSYT
jgi:hypothetical protein